MSAESSKAREARAIARWDTETDVLVVGLGCAGAAAALEASAAGARVTVLERASGGGGTSALSGGVLYLGGGTPLQKECGFEDSPEDMFAYLMASCGERPPEDKVRAYCEGSVEHYHWLVECGVPFKPVFYPDYSGEPPTDDGLVFSGNENAHPYREQIRPAPRGHVPRVPGAAGGLLMQKLCGAVDRSAAEVRTDSRALALIVDGEAVVGAVVSASGEQRAVRARAGVVLAAGGFINDRDMLATHAPQLLRCKYRVGAEGDDGSGIRIGLGAGGAAVNLGMGSISLPLTPPKSVQKGILVDGQGQRFTNEDAYMGRLGELALLRAGGQAYLILDDASFVRPQVPRELLAVEETPEALGRELGLPPGSLESTLAIYNRHAALGRDPVFHKVSDFVVPLATPPYAALDCRTESSLYAAFTLGGLASDAQGRVLDADGRPVPGLFAAGRTTACLACPGYASGLSLGDGTFFGRRAGRSAAAGR